MKKYFAFVAASLMLVSLASCNKKGGNDPEPEVDPVAGVTFQIEVSDITYNSAHVKVTPSDEKAIYFWNVVDKESVDTHSGGKIADYAAAEMAYYLEKGVAYADLVDGYMIIEGGSDEYDFTLDPATEYIAYAFVTNEKLEIVGEVASKSFASIERKEGEPLDEYEALVDLQHDFAEYTVDLSYIATYGTIDVVAQDQTHALYLEFNVAETATDLVAGTYSISASGEAGTVSASQGLMSYMGYTFVTPSYAAELSEGQISKPWYLQSGTVVVKEDGSIEVDALNSALKSYKGKLTTRVEQQEGGEEAAPARKALKKSARTSFKGFKNARKEAAVLSK